MMKKIKFFIKLRIIYIKVLLKSKFNIINKKVIFNFHHLGETNFIIQALLNLKEEERNKYIFINIYKYNNNLFKAYGLDNLIYEFKKNIKIKNIFLIPNLSKSLILLNGIFSKIKLLGYNFEGDNPEKNTSTISLLDYYCNVFSVEKKKIYKPIITNTAKENIDKFLLKNNLLDKKYLFFSPDSQSVNSLNLYEIEKIIKKYEKENYIIFINYNKNDIDYLLNEQVIKIFFTMEETYYLASLCHKIIALRSGLVDFLSSIEIDDFTILYRFLPPQYYNLYTFNNIYATTKFNELAGMNFDLLTKIINKKYENI